MGKKKHYLYGEDPKDASFYRVYIGTDYSYNKLKKHIKSLEGFFISEVDLRRISGTQGSLEFRKDKLKQFEQLYCGKFISFDKS